MLDAGQGSPLWNDLDAMDRKMMSQATLHELMVGTALAVSSSLTVGYVIWMLRGGMLVTSLIAQMPAWRILDPLVVLSRAGDADYDGEEETLATIVDSYEDQAARTHERPSSLGFGAALAEPAAEAEISV